MNGQHSDKSVIITGNHGQSTNQSTIILRNDFPSDEISEVLEVKHQSSSAETKSILTCGN